VIRGGLNYNLELRWDGVPSLAAGLRMVREQAARTPPGQWVRVVGGWSEYQFAERRPPTLAELNAASDSVPVFVLYLYGRAFLNRAALRAVGITRETPDPPGGRIERDAAGEPTGLLVAAPSALILYSNLAKGPRLSPADQVNSTRHFLRELNRLGYTSSVDAGGGGQAYPDHYAVAEGLARAGQLPMRVSYYLFAQQGGRELADYERWAAITRPGDDRGLLRPNGYVMEGAGEQVVAAAADFENFLEPRPTLADSMEATFEPVVRHFVARRWPFRIHGTYDESISRFLDVFERVDRDTPFGGLRFVVDHAETIGARNVDRIRALGGGVSVQHRMAYQGEHFLARYGREAAGSAPPVKLMLARGAPGGPRHRHDARGRLQPLGGAPLADCGPDGGRRGGDPPANRLTREGALRLFTVGSAWVSGEEREKGGSRRGSTPTSRCSPPTTSPSRTARCPASRACSPWSAGARCTAPAPTRRSPPRCRRSARPGPPSRTSAATGQNGRHAAARPVPPVAPRSWLSAPPPPAAPRSDPTRRGHARRSAPRPKCPRTHARPPARRATGTPRHPRRARPHAGGSSRRQPRPRSRSWRVPGARRAGRPTPRDPPTPLGSR
jgi:predicted amidohydrolase YtcJ